MRQVKVLGCEAVVRYLMAAVGPVRLAKVQVCWMGDWCGDWPDWLADRLGEDSFETVGESQEWPAGHHQYR